MTFIQLQLVQRGWRALVVLALLSVAMPAHAQRVALLVGNANYSVGRLTNPPNDVAAMEKALGALGFKVQKLLNANQNQMKRAVRDFGSAAQGAEVAFLYYSGHGTQANGENYLLPVGASIEKESDYPIEAIAANDVLAQIRGAQPKAAILVLDACRDNPLAAVTKSATKGLGRMSAPTGTMIAFATAPGDTASDNGHYARVLAKEIQKPGQELVDVFRNTAAEVRKLSASGKVQDPRISEMSINERLYLAGPGTQLASLSPEPTGQPVAAQADPDQEAWELAKRRDTAAAYQAYLDTYPQGRFADPARVALKGMQAPVQPTNSTATASKKDNTNHKNSSTSVQIEVLSAAQALEWKQALEEQRAAIDGKRTEFIELGGGVLLDPRNRMEWTKQSSPQPLDWSGGNEYCQRRGENWRLPSIAELQSLVDRTLPKQPCGVGDVCPIPSGFKLQNGVFWSSERKGDDAAWFVVLVSGEAVSHKDGFTFQSVLCVRPATKGASKAY